VSREPAPARVLAWLGIAEDAFLGAGAEAQVYALDARRVARIHARGVARADVSSRASLLSELAAGAGAVPFAIPRVLDIAVVETRLISIESRLPGRALSDALTDARGEQRARLIRAYLEAAARIGDLRLDRAWYGDVSPRDPIRTATFREYLRERARKSLAAAGPDFAAVDPGPLAAALPEPSSPALVHLDAFPGNMLAEDNGITAVLDFGTVSIVGDRRLDPLTAVAYLDSPITPAATPTDRRVASEWLRDHRLLDLYPPARRWLGAYWSFAREDPRLFDWCRGVLLASAP
jgi:aminoglycoside phosphotransferase (APT) family kinase protein